MTDQHHATVGQPSGRYLAVLSLTALGVVYGDIGTSPLYAVRECFVGEHGMAIRPVNVLGVLSLIVWSLLGVISLKYLAYVMRADNRGEGGILALMALALDPRQPVRRQWLVFILGLFGAALLYGDGAITPAISVLSAVEGVQVAAPALGPFVVPITIVILVLLFSVQRRGTAGVGLVFGPITLVWFAVLIALGVYQIAENPGILRALSPAYAVDYFGQHGIAGLAVLGSVFLVVTGGEALYADMGHFGPRPIRLAWFAIVLPALVINYFGQGALILRDPSAAEAPLFRMAPGWAVIPLVLLSTAATVIASQAVISGTYSLTRQAIQLGYAPRLEVAHTSAREEGQIYLPTVNWALLVATIVLVIGFGSSTNLASAYGIAVTTTMVITTVLAHVVARRVWGWSLLAALPLTACLLVVDLAFFGANVLKIADGGWVPLAMAMAVFLAMSTWKRGREILSARLAERTIPWDQFDAFLISSAPARVPGTAVYMAGRPDLVPPALIQNVRHNRSLHERVIFLSLIFTQQARVPAHEKLRLDDLGDGFLRIEGSYGFVESPDVPKLLALTKTDGVDIDIDTTTFVMGRETLVATTRPGMALWREVLFAFMSRNARRAASFFRIPSERVLEIGSQIEL